METEKDSGFDDSSNTHMECYNDSTASENGRKSSENKIFTDSNCDSISGVTPSDLKFDEGV